MEQERRKRSFLEALSHAALDNNAVFTVVKLHEKNFAVGAWILRMKNGDTFLLFADAKIVDARKKYPPARALGSTLQCS